MGYDYIGMSYQEKKASEGVPISIIFGMSLLFRVPDPRGPI